MKHLLLFALLLVSLSAFSQAFEVSDTDTTTTSQVTRSQTKFYNGIPYRVKKNSVPRRLGFYDEIQAAASGGVQQVNSIAPTAGNVNITYANLLSKPTTVSGFGITDAVSTGGSYANPAWLTSLPATKVTGLATVATSGLFADVASKPTTLSGYGITDALSSAGSYTNPSWLVSIPFSKLTTTPTTVAGYGITDVIPYSVVPNYAGLSGVSAPASGFLKLVMVTTDAQYSETNSLYIITSAGKIKKIGLLPSEN